jgi:hypothetical protein
MMGYRAKLGDEWDALTPAGAKRAHRWRAGIRRSIKRRFNKRQRTRTAFEKVATPDATQSTSAPPAKGRVSLIVVPSVVPCFVGSSQIVGN